jgi:hypothetical protein
MLADPTNVTESKRRQAAAYVASMISELALIAQNHQLDTLSYILEMARLEAENAGLGSSKQRATA